MALDSRLAGIETRLSVLTWAATTTIALLFVLLGSQFALWGALGKLNGMVAAQGARIEAQLTQLKR